MRSFQSLLLVFILASLLQCQGVPIEDFFPTNGFSAPDSETLTFPGLSTSCEQVETLDVTVEGTANLSSASSTPVTFTPFHVTSTNLDASSRFILQSSFLQMNSLQNVSELENLYKEYYPRNAKERSFIIKRMMTITWELTTGQQTNRFQVVAAFNDTKNTIFVLYQYQDGMMQWNSVDSEVSMLICGDEWTYDLLAGNLLNTSLVNGSNVKVPGRYAFLYNDSGINPAVICGAGCDLNRGYCKVEDTCTCLDGWMGDTCTQIACHTVCDIHGSCPSQPYVCVCDSDNQGPTYSGANCTIPRCNGCSGRGTCHQPDTCTCITGWTGGSCETPICATQCSNGGQCVAPNTCECTGGWEGQTCTEHYCNECVNGDCIGPLTCECIVGWSGGACTVANCSAECMINGYCAVPNNCTCNEGWEGINCEEPICLEGCATEDGGYCELPGLCNCTEGYFGELCDSTQAPPLLSATEIGLLAGGLIAFVIIVAVVISALILAIRLC